MSAPRTLDLLMVHWPSPEKVPLAETMHALAKSKREGKARNLGVANFNIAMIEEAIRLCPEPIINVQVEYHPYLDQTKATVDAIRDPAFQRAYGGPPQPPSRGVSAVIIQCGPSATTQRGNHAPRSPS